MNEQEIFEQITEEYWDEEDPEYPLKAVRIDPKKLARYLSKLDLPTELQAGKEDAPTLKEIRDGQGPRIIAEEQPERWEEEFDKKFPYAISGPPGQPNSWFHITENLPDKIKEFIKALLRGE